MIDFHVHLDLYPDPKVIAQEIDKHRMYVLSVTTTPSAWKGTSALGYGHSRIRTALGLHPQLAHERIHELPLFDKYLHETKYVGEIGLDGSSNLKPHRDVQLHVFKHILCSCSLAGGKIMSIHSRRSATEVLNQLEIYPHAGKAVLHWFTGSKKELLRAIELNCWFSVGPAMFRTEKSINLIRLIPKERILTETDGPFVQLNKHYIYPWDVNKAIIKLAAIWGLSINATEIQLKNNFRSLLIQST